MMGRRAEDWFACADIAEYCRGEAACACMDRVSVSYLLWRYETGAGSCPGEEIK